jgi:nuclear pore complex protein Nup98-Nup96
MRLRLREIAVEESKEEPVVRLTAVSPPVQENMTRPPVAASPFSTPSEAATPAGVTSPPDSAKLPAATPTNGHGYDFYNKVIASAGATPGSKTVGSPVESKSLVPKLTKPDYAVAPSLEEMASMSEADLATVSGFTVSKAGVGSVSWDGSVDVRGVDLDEAISINVRDVAVYDSAEANGSKPSVGTKLNRPAVITIYNIVPKPGANAEDIEKFERRVIKSTKNMNAELISYDVTSGVWTFRVPHFSRYGLFDDSEEEDEDMELENSSSQHFESGERGGRSPEKESEIRQKGGGDMDVSPSRFSAFVSEDEGVVDVSLVSDVETGVENNVLTEAERAYKMMSAAMASDKSRKEQPKSVLKKKQNEAEASLLFPDEGAVIEARVNPAPMRPDEQDLSMSSRPRVCARIAKRCGVQSFSASSTDFGLRMGRSFRVGWKPDGSFLHLQSESIAVIQQSTPVFTDESDGKQQVEKLLEIHLKHSTKISSLSRECPSFSLAAGIDSSADNVVRKMLSDYVLACDRHGGKESDPEQGLILMRAFSLLLCLFTDQSNDSNDTAVPMIEGFEGKKAQVAVREQGRIDDCVKWLKAACAEDVRKDVRDALQKNHVHSAIFAALTGGDIEQASSIAMKHGQLHLASLIAIGAAGFNSIQDQVQQWHESGAAKTFPPELLRIYSLLGGDLTAEEQIHLALTNERRKTQLDWRRRLCMLFAFGSHPDDETTLESLIVQYEKSVADDVAPYPFPRYLSNKQDDMKDDAQPAQSLLYRILKLASNMGGCSSEHDLSSVSLATVVAPSGYTAASTDFSGAFHIAAAISALGLGPSLSPLEQARLLDGYASQLVNIGRWDLAVYVMLCVFGVDCPEDLVSREQIAKTLILRNYSETSPPGLIAKRSHLEKIGVPSAWFEEAVAYHCSHRGDAYEYVRHLSRFSPEQALRAVEELVVPNMLFMSVTDVRKSLELLEVFPWDYESLAATVLDFFQLSEDILILSQNENAANESEMLASLSEMATSVKERLLVHGAFTEGLKATSCGLRVIPSYRVVPMAVFLAESLAGLSFLQLQLKALEAGSSIWGEAICGRPYKVASELAFIAAGDRCVSRESNAVASEVALRGSI